MINKEINLKIKGLVFFTLFISTFACFGQTDRWFQLEKDLRIYIQNPTHDNAIKVYNLLPNSKITNGFPEGQVLEHIRLYSVELEDSIIGENRDALKIGFRLFSIADGEFAEFMDLTIGELITRNPQLFLEELKNHRQLVHLSNLVGHYDIDFADNPEYSLNETNRRIESLKKVNEQELLFTRDECIKQLENFKATLTEMIKNVNKK